MSGKSDLAVIIPVSERFDELVSLVTEYRAGLDTLGMTYEFVFVLDGPFPDLRENIRRLKGASQRVKIVQLARWFGEATALAVGIKHTESDLVLTLPAYQQVEASRAAEVVSELEESGVDMVVAVRGPRTDSKINQVQAKVFHALFNFLTGSRFHDLGCGVRAFRRAVADEVPLYGDQHRFFPVLAERVGFRVRELALPQAIAERSVRIYGAGVYIRRLIDILTMLFLLKFTKKPLRFFGLIGSATFAVGGALVAWLVVQRLFFGIPLADRPALLLSSLLVVIGIQLFALGLIGELIIFAHVKDLPEYRIAEIVE